MDQQVHNTEIGMLRGSNDLTSWNNNDMTPSGNRVKPIQQEIADKRLLWYGYVGGEGPLHHDGAIEWYEKKAKEQTGGQHREEFEEVAAWKNH